MDSFSAQAPTYRDFNAESSHEDNINFFGEWAKLQFLVYLIIFYYSFDFAGLSCEDDVRIKEEPLSPDYFQTPSGKS